MKSHCITRSCLALLQLGTIPAAIAVSIAMPLLAQVPAHHAVVGTISFPGLPVTFSGKTGVFIVPLPTTANPGEQTPELVMGLPPALRVDANAFGGAFSVRYRASDSTLFVGDGAAAGGVTNVHVLNLNGTAVRTAVAVPFGKVSPGSIAAANLALFPDGRVLVSTGALFLYVAGSGPGAISPLSILDTRGPNPVVTPIMLGPGIGRITGGCAVSADGLMAYVTTQTQGGFPPCNLYRIDVNLGTVTLLHTWPNEITVGPSLSHDGLLYVASFNPGTLRSTFYRFDTNANPVVVTSLALVPPDVSLVGPALEPATGRLLFSSFDWNGCRGGRTFANSLVMSGKQGGTLALLAAEPVGGWCIPFAIDVNASFDRYGAGTPAANSYSIVDCPNPGGLPEIGNSNFSITVRANGGSPLVSWMLIGSTAGNLNILGMNMLVNPPWIALPMITVGSSQELALPVPNRVSLVGVELFAQSVHLDSGGFASSDALRITIL